MKYRTLAGTDIEVSAVAFGCWAIAGGFNWGHQEESDSIEALRSAYDAGFTLFDTAEGYGDGHSEKLLSKALSDVRDTIVIATKVSPSNFAPDSLRKACERSLRNLETDRIDLYQLHWPNRDIPFEETLGILEELKKEGKVREYGVSNFGTHDLGQCLETEYHVCTNQIAYSLLFRAIEYEILPLCVKEDISVLCYSSLMQGLLTGKFIGPDEVPENRSRTRHFACSRPNARHSEQGAEAETFSAIKEIRQIADELGEPMADVSLAWLVGQEGVASVIVGARNADQAQRNARSGDLILPQEVLDRLSIVTDELKQKLGPSPDLWQSESRIR